MLDAAASRLARAATQNKKAVVQSCRVTLRSNSRGHSLTSGHVLVPVSYLLAVQSGVLRLKRTLLPFPAFCGSIHRGSLSTQPARTVHFVSERSATFDGIPKPAGTLLHNTITCPTSTNRPYHQAWPKAQSTNRHTHHLATPNSWSTCGHNASAVRRNAIARSAASGAPSTTFGCGL